MKIVNFVTELEYYNDGVGNVVVHVTEDFWKRLKAGKVRYKTGGDDAGKFFTEELLLDIKDSNFREVFLSIADTTAGEDVMLGKDPVDTVL